MSYKDPWAIFTLQNHDAIINFDPKTIQWWNLGSTITYSINNLWDLKSLSLISNIFRVMQMQLKKLDKILENLIIPKLIKMLKVFFHLQMQTFYLFYKMKITKSSWNLRRYLFFAQSTNFIIINSRLFVKILVKKLSINLLVCQIFCRRMHLFILESTTVGDL